MIETNTQTRQLRLLGELVRQVENQKPLFVLETEMHQWSEKEEQLNPTYRKATGKLTEKGKKTQAFKYYISFAKKLQLISVTGQLVEWTKFGEIFTLLFPTYQAAENLFFWYWLMKYDADTLLTIGQIVANATTPLKDVAIRLQYMEQLKTRFWVKIKQANSNTVLATETILRQLETETSHSLVAHKHLVPPRLVWLQELGILNTGTKYQFTPVGMAIWKQLPTLKDGMSKDISENWLKQVALTDFKAGMQPLLWENIAAAVQKQWIAQSLSFFYEKTYKSKENSYRMNGYSALLFAVFHIHNCHQVTVNRTDLELILKTPLVQPPYLFVYSPAERHYESYITITFI
jgi:hypothetical protein